MKCLVYIHFTLLFLCICWNNNKCGVLKYIEPSKKKSKVDMSKLKINYWISQFEFIVQLHVRAHYMDAQIQYIFANTVYHYWRRGILWFKFELSKVSMSYRNEVKKGAFWRGAWTPKLLNQHLINSMPNGIMVHIWYL